MTLMPITRSTRELMSVSTLFRRDEPLFHQIVLMGCNDAGHMAQRVEGASADLTLARQSAKG